MGIIIILAVVLAIFVALEIIASYVMYDGDVLLLISGVFAVLFSIALICVSIGCIVTQAGKETTLYRYEQEREALVESYNTYYNNYDKDLAHSQSLKEIRAEIAEFNATINKNNYFCDNFFVNLFYIDCTEIEPIIITNGTAE